MSEAAASDAEVLGGPNLGLTDHRVLMLICERCSYVLTFYDGDTIFDFD